MSLITLKPNLSKFQKKSEAIFDVFTKTKADAESLNNEILSLKEQRLSEMKKISDEVKELDIVYTKNANLAGKIDKFLNS